MNKSIYFILLLVMINHVAFSAEGNVATRINSLKVKISEDTQKEFDVVSSHINDFSIYELDVEKLNSLLSKDQSASRIQLNFGIEYSWDLFLEKFDVRSEEYVLRSSTPEGVKQFARSTLSSYKGYSNDDVNDMVRMTIKSDYISGYVKGSDGLIFIEPASNYYKSSPSNHYVIYNVKNAKEAPGQCGLANKGLVNQLFQVKKYLPTQQNVALDSSCVMTEIAIATTKGVLDKNSGDVLSVESHVTELLNLASGFFYQAPLNIDFTISEIYVSGINYEIIPAGTPSTSFKLNVFRSWGQSDTSFVNTFDVATLWLTEGFGSAGVAWFNGVCSTFKYNLCGYNNSQIRRYTIQAHELGHNYNATHTNNLMTTSVNNNATGFSDININEILEFKSTRTCLDSVTTCGLAAPVSDFIANKDTICIGDSVSFTNLSTSDVGIFYWKFPGSENTSYFKETPPAITYLTPGVYNVQLKVSSPTGTDVTLKTSYITVSDDCNVTPPLITTSTVDFVCNTDSLTLDAGLGYASYLWSNNATTQLITVPAGDYTVTTLDANLITQTSDTFTIYQNECFTNDTLLAVWNMNDGNGTIVQDSSVFGNHGDLLDGTWDYDGCRKSIKFDKTDDYIEIPDFFYGNDFSLQIWMNTTNSSGNALQYFYSHGANGAANSINVHYKESSNEIRTNLKDYNDNNSSLNFTENTISDGNWHLYTLTVEEGVGSKIYYDGVERKISNHGADVVNPSGSIILGARSDLHSSRFYNGKLDDVRIYNHTLDSAGVMDYFLLNSICDSIVPTDTIVSCGSYTWVNGVIYTESVDTVTFNIGNTMGGDSIIKLDLTIFPLADASFSYIGNEYCDSGMAIPTYSSGAVGGVFTSSAGLSLNSVTGEVDLDNSIIGTYSVINSIDSDDCPLVTHAASITILGSVTMMQADITACDSVEVYGIWYFTSQTVEDTYPNSAINGCDSTDVTEIIISLVDTSISVSSNTITANATDATYQWVDCDNGYAPILGEISQSFTPTTNGNYAVNIIQNGCIDTSACSFILISKTEEVNAANINVFPNPVKDILSVEVNVSISQMTIYSVEGKLMKIQSNNKKDIDVKALASGIYILKVKTEYGIAYMRFVKI